ncbi:MAG TPA: hypothetical protein VLV50_09775 [Stellaceae bacterium]|nr:hypothetical protein [Stellaceae bacterium]
MGGDWLLFVFFAMVAVAGGLSALVSAFEHGRDKERHPEHWEP